VRFLKDGFKRRVKVFSGLHTVVAADVRIHHSPLNGARSVEGERHGEVTYVLWLQLPQEGAHARAL